MPDGARQAPDPASFPSSVVLDVGGLAVRVVATPGPAAEVVRSFLGAGRPTERRPDLDLAAETGLVVPPPQPPEIESEGIRLWRAGEDILALHERGVGVRAGRRFELTVPADGSGWEPAARRMLTLGLGHVAGRHRRVLVHAAAIVVAEHAVLFIGDSGAGKSTLAWAAHGRGLAVLADDLVLARANHEPPEVAGVPRPFAVSRADAGGLGEPLLGDPRGRVALAGEALTPGLHPVGATVLLTADGSPDLLAPASPRAVVRAVLGGCSGLGRPDRNRAALQWASAVARRPAIAVARATRDNGRDGARLDAVLSALSGLAGSGPG